MTVSVSLKVALVLPPKEGFSPGRVGAIGSVIHRLATAPADGVDPPIAADVIGPPLPAPPLSGVPYHAVPVPAWPAFAHSRRYARNASLTLRRLAPRVIEVHNRVRLALSVAAACRPTPVVLVLHNDPTEMQGAKRAGQRRKLLRRLAGVVCVSDYIRHRFMRGVEAPADRVPLVLINALDLAALPPSSEDRDRLILFVGRVVKDKGADTFVAGCRAALPHLPGWRAEIIGADRFRPDSPDTPFIRALRRQAQGIELRGYRPHEVALQAMSRAAIVVVPSRWQDPCPLVALEAMGCGAALIVTRRGGLPELCGDAAIYIDAESPESLTRALLDLALEPDRLAAVRHACQARVRRFDLAPAMQRWNALRRQLAADCGATAAA